MRLLLDTHALLYWWGQPDGLSPRAKALIADPEQEILVSAASAWEIATKVRIGKLPGFEHVSASFALRCSASGFRELPISHSHATKAGSLTSTHRDPFDRMLAAQGLIEELSVVTKDPQIAALGAPTIW